MSDDLIKNERTRRHILWGELIRRGKPHRVQPALINELGITMAVG